MRFKGKKRKEGSALWTDKEGKNVWVGKDYAKQNQIDEAKAKTLARSCFKGCRTCGACANSRRDASWPYEFDNGEKVNCLTCEPFRFHDCHNGVLRDSHQEAEPFTFDMIQILEETGGKPLI